MDNHHRTAWLLSPHFDDAVFSCGGIAATLARRGWQVRIVTAFTRPVHPASGFALECQRDKGLGDEVDYMALRRDEDRAACATLGVAPVLLDLPEAPNRGYPSAASLFAPPRGGDDVARVLAGRLLSRLAEERPALVLAPQGCGRHVDHVRMIDAVLELQAGDEPDAPVFGFYRDTPYVIRDPQASPDARVAGLATQQIEVQLDDAVLACKQDAVACYGSQLGFQFGGEVPARVAIDALARQEAGGHGHAERLRTAAPLRLQALLA